MARLELGWFGPPAVLVDGVGVKLETRKVTALLALLSVEQRPLARERLAAMLWPEFDATRAPANLRRALSSLQSSIGAEWITADRETVMLRPSREVTVDVVTLLQVVAAAQAHHRDGAEGLCSRCETPLAHAVTAYRGDFLTGLNLADAPEFDLWQLTTRGETQNAVLWAFQRLVKTATDDGRIDEALGFAQRHLSLDVLNEATHRTLMDLYCLSGNFSAALRQFDLCAQVLQDELGTEPDSATCALRDRARRGVSGAPSGRRAPSDQPTTDVEPGRVNNPVDRLSHRLRPPISRHAAIERARLLAALAEGMHCPVTLVSAPAGFGKTTLLVEWTRRCGTPVAWVTADQGDSDCGRFLLKMSAAFNTIDSSLCVGTLSALQSFQTPPVLNVLESLIADLQQDCPECALVIDDFHLAEGQEVANLIAGFVERMPPQIHLYLATRADPPLPLARMRARGLLVEIRTDELRFTRDEAATFVAGLIDGELAAEEIEVLKRRTEGWAAGLQMAALSLRRSADRRQFLESFSGSHRYVMDYLLEEVLAGQDALVRHFLLRTSIVDRFCAEIADAMLETSDAAAMIETLDRSNLFIVALDDQRKWYRYHHLFADLLRHRLSTECSDEDMAALHKRAGLAFLSIQEVETAMEHFLRGGLYDEALDLVQAQNQRILVRGGLRLLLDWMRRIPESLVIDDPSASALFGAFHALSGNEAEAERWFLAVDGTAPDDDRIAEPEPRIAEARGLASVFRALLADMAGRWEETIELAEAAETLLPRDDLMTRSIIPYVMSRACRMSGDLDRSDEFLDTQIHTSLVTRNSFTLASAVHEKVRNAQLRGRLRAADEILTWFARSVDSSQSRGPIAKTIAARADLSRERGDLDDAWETVNESVAAAMTWGIPSDICFCLQTRIRVALSRRDIVAVAEDLQLVQQQIAGARVYSSIELRHEVQRVRMLLMEGKPAEAAQLVSLRRRTETESPIDREAAEIAHARVLISLHHHAEAAMLVRRLASKAEAGGRYGRLLEILVLEAAALSNDWIKPLSAAILLAAQEGYIQVFADAGADVLEKLRSATGSPKLLPRTSGDYAKEILEKLTK